MQVSKDALFAASSPFFLEDLTLIPSAQRFRQQHVKFNTKLYLTQQKCAPASSGVPAGQRYAVQCNAQGSPCMATVARAHTVLIFARP